MKKAKQFPKQGAVTASYKAAPTVTDMRKKMKYKVSTTSVTATGVVPIKGATKYPPQPTIYFTREAWVKQCHLVHKCTMEVGWFALVDHDEKDNSFTITELVIPCQEVTAAETDIGKEDLADAAMELIEAGKDTSKMYAWFHSHVNMGVSPSAQDEYQVEDFLEDLADQTEVPAFIRGIQNKKGDLKLDVYYVQHGIAYQNLDFHVIHDDDPQWLVDIDSEVKTKVSTRKPTPYSGFGGNRYNTDKSGFRNPNLYPYGNVWSNPDYDNEDDYYGRGGVYNYSDYDADDGAVVAEVSDTPDMPKKIDMDDFDFAQLELVYKSPTNVEILLAEAGHLVVCDEIGEMYDYCEYTEVFGEIDGDVKYATPIL